MNTHERGSDLSFDRRPGVPMENSPPHPFPHAQHMQPPVRSSRLPPRGISGLIRRGAYRVPGHLPSHWMMLLFADRVDVMEHKFARLLRWLALPAAAFFVLRLARR